MKNETKQLLMELKNNNEDFELYPTTDEILSNITIPRDCNSVLDIGCGTCAFDRYFERKYELKKQQDEYAHKFYSKYYVIEKSNILIQKFNKDIIVLGSDFNNTTLIDKKVDMIFCNPPYSEFENWTTRIIREGNCKYIYLVIPSRWKDNQDIKNALERTNSTYIVVGSFDFLNAERQARAKVDLVRIEKSQMRNRTPFDLWFEETFKVEVDNKTDWEKERIKQEEQVKNLKNQLIQSDNKIEMLVNLYNDELSRLQQSFFSICSMDSKILSDIGVDWKKVKESLEKKLETLKILYWDRVFEYLEEITERLTHNSRDLLKEKFTKLNCVDFTIDNIRNVVIWVLKNANQYFNDQLINFFKELSDRENVKPYKSNTKLFENDGWRWTCQDKCNYTLDYRIITHKYNWVSSYSWEGNISTRNIQAEIEDMRVIANNLGFNVGNHELATEFGKKYYCYLENGDVLFEYKIYKNGNAHIKMNIEFSKALNVEVGRLLGWIRSKEDIVNEFADEMKGAEKYFNKNISLVNSNIKLLGV